MKQRLRQKQKLSVNLTSSLGNQIKLLSLSGFEVSKKLNALINDYFDEDDKKVSYFREQYLLDKYRNLLNQGRDLIHQSSEVSESDIRQKLLGQLEINASNNIQILVGEYLIDSVESNGRLDPEIDFEDIKKMVLEDFGEKITNEIIENTLYMIQNFEPPGCAYRDIAESLYIQIENLELSVKEKTTLKVYVESILDERLEIDELSSVENDNLSKLSINPAASFGETNEIYIRPDVLAIPNQGEWLVSLNDDFMSKELVNMIRAKIDSNKDDNDYDSRSFLKGLERRQQTLLVVSEFLIEIQKEYLLGIAGKRAISSKEIASKLNLSESTISRIVRNKYLQLPDRLILLKDLIERRINKHKDGADVTANDLKLLIEELIKSEDESNPLSDEYLKHELKKKFKVNLARRTIAKYRLDLRIPPSNKRLKDLSN